MSTKPFPGLPLGIPYPNETENQEQEGVALAAIQQRIEGFGEADLSPLRSFCERIVGATALIGLSPLIAIVAILVAVDSPGPIFYRQWRVGRNGRLFQFTKFRTYFVDAKERFPELYAYDFSAEEIEQYRFKIPNDPRATRMGRWLRTTTLDELPNFLNVMTGDMVLVGPRPEIPEMLPYYRPSELRKFAVRPGVTGLAQTLGRGDLTFRETVRLDVEYVFSRHLWADLKILARTCYLVVMRDGAF